jgi:hypothetical protein
LGSYLAWRVLEMVRSLAYCEWGRYVESGGGRKVDICGVDFGGSISDAS